MPDQNSSSSRFLRKEDVKQPSADPANSLIDGIVRFFIGLGILGSAFYAAWWYPTAPLFICGTSALSFVSVEIPSSLAHCNSGGDPNT